MQTSLYTLLLQIGLLNLIADYRLSIPWQIGLNHLIVLLTVTGWIRSSSEPCHGKKVIQTAMFTGVCHLHSLARTYAVCSDKQKAKANFSQRSDHAKGRACPLKDCLFLAMWLILFIDVIFK